MRYSDMRLDGVDCRVTWLEVMATSLEEVVHEMVDHLAKTKLIQATDAAVIARDLAQKERRCGTAWGKGIAMPHMKTPRLSAYTIAIDCSRSGLDLHALDRAPTYLLFMALSPLGKLDDHLAVQECLYRLVQRDSFRRWMRQASNYDEALELMQEYLDRLEP